MAEVYTKAQIDEIAAIIGDRIKANRGFPGSPHAMEPGLAAGEYITAALNGLAPGTGPTAAGRLEFMPFRPGKTITVDNMVIDVTTAVAASQARIGIYSSLASGLPGALLTGQGTLLDCASTGSKASAIAGGLLLQAGTLYWLAVHGSSTQTFRALPIGALMPLPIAQTSTAHNTQRRATATFANGLPAAAPATTLTSAVCPMVKLRVA